MPALRVLIHLNLANMPATVPRYPRQLNESFREAQINPSIVVIIIILTIIFFLSGCLHLLIRCLVMRNPRRDPNSIVTLTALQGQLQQLFHLHDSGVEQAFIDTLPVFFYKSVTGLKEGADCAVCLCEFEAEDRLRLLPKCSHAFHMDCIDTWLLSHSTCPLCRRSLLPDDVAAIATSHQAGLLLDSSRSSIDAEAVQRAGSDQLASENVSTAAESLDDTSGWAHVACNPTDHLSCKPVDGPEISAAVELGASVSFPEGHPQTQYAGKVLSVQLGRFRVVEAAAGTHSLQGGVSSSSITGSRRSYSVGSYEYVLDPWSSEVVIAPTPLCKRTGTPRRPSTPGHRATLSECAQSDALPDPLTFARAAPIVSNGHHEKPAGWLNCAISSGSMDIAAVNHHHLHPPDCTSGDHKNSRRAFSFRQPINEEAMKLKVSASRRSLSEASEVLRTQDEQKQLHHDPCTFFSGSQLVSASTELSNYSLPSAHQGANYASFRRGLAPYSLLAKRTFKWLVGRQNRWTASLEASVV